tara:strand:+ start:2081 stop:3178 length:1098 start_codon:yes stop_codon:yes gene_type:complete
MKIAYDYNIFFTQKYGGISRYFCSIIKEIIKKKNENKVKIFSPLFKNRYLLEISKQFRSGIYIPRYPIYNYLKNIVENTSYKQIKNSDFDIIHNTYYNSKIVNIKNKKKVVTVYDLIHEKFSKLYSENNLYNKKETIENADHIICISENTKKDLLQYYNINESKVSTIYLGFDHLSNDYSKINFDKLLLPKNFILFVGSRKKYKNFDLLLEAFKIKKNIIKDFEIVCFGGGKFNNKELNKFKNFGLNDRIKNYQGNDILLSYLYTKAQLFVFPSSYEGFGLPLIEAMSQNCPVLASENSTFVELAKDSIHFFENNNLEDLAFKIDFLLKSENDLNSKKLKAIEISKQYTWENCTNKTLEIYKKLF